MNSGEPAVEVSTKGKPRYAFVLPWSAEQAGGVNEVVRNLMRECRRDGRYEPLLVENCWDAGGLVEDRALGYDRVRLRIRSPWDERRPLRALALWIVLLPLALVQGCNLVRRYRVDVLNAHFPDLYVLTFILLKRLRLFEGRIILSVHGSDIRGASRLSGWPRWLWTRLLGRADFVVACSGDLGDEVREFFPSCGERLRVIHNGADIDLFHAEADRAFSLPPELAGRRFIVNIGKFIFWKGHDVLLNAFSIVKRTDHDLMLVIIGAHGDEFVRTQALVAHLGLAGSVVLLRNVPHCRIPSFLYNAQALVLSSRWKRGLYGEGFPVALLEAAAAAVPVAATASCGVRELVQDGQTGRVVPCEDVAALAGAVGDLLRNPQKGKRLGENLRQKVRCSFTWAGAFRQYAVLTGTTFPESAEMDEKLLYG